MLLNIFTLTSGCCEDAPSITSENINFGLFVDRNSAFNMLTEEGQTYTWASIYEDIIK